MQFAYIAVTIGTLLLAAVLLYITVRVVKRYKKSGDKADRQKVASSLLSLFILIVLYVLFITISRILTTVGLL
jgi:predicted PurR-regulated permease PerM